MLNPSRRGISRLITHIYVPILFFYILKGENEYVVFRFLVSPRVCEFLAV